MLADGQSLWINLGRLYCLLYPLGMEESPPFSQRKEADCNVCCSIIKPCLLQSFIKPCSTQGYQLSGSHCLFGSTHEPTEHIDGKHLIVCRQLKAGREWLIHKYCMSGFRDQKSDLYYSHSGR